jgi:hypothetical protein
MSFAMTTKQFIDGTKDVTRRFGWWNIKVGDKIRAVEKGMGLKKGEKIKALGVIEVISVRSERLHDINQEDCIREGFPNFTPRDFINMLMKHYKCDADKLCNRIEFRRVP